VHDERQTLAHIDLRFTQSRTVAEVSKLVQAASRQASSLKSVVSLLGQVSSQVSIYLKLECGPMPNVMVALPNRGGALYSTPQSLADAGY